MRRLAALLVTLAACGEPAAVRTPPMDRFLAPTGLALTSVPARSGGGASALLVGSSNFDLNYDGPTGGTVLSVNPDPAAEGGSAGQPGGALVRLPATGGARIGSYAGNLAVADGRTCPGYVDPVHGSLATALVPSRFDGALHRVPVAADGGVVACDAPGCRVAFDVRLLDPYVVTLGCRRGGARRSAFVGFLQVAALDGATAASGHVAEVDLDDPSGATPGFFPVGRGPISDMAYDAVTDRLFVATRPAVAAAPSSQALLYAVDLGSCRPGQAGCAAPQEVDLFDALRGADLQGLALSNPQPGLTRRLYVAVRVYDVSLFSLLGFRPSTDQAGALLVLDAEEDETGRPALSLVRVVPVGLGPGQVRVLPQRPALPGGAPRRDLVVVASTQDGAVAVYDDQLGAVARTLALDPDTGAPEAGRAPYALAVEPVPTGGAAPVARVYVAAFKQSVVSLVDVPLLAPGSAQALRGAAGELIRIGGVE
ncbi:MAG: hypothetical protein IPO09_16065 [Anaeromyxobacter sp.]|nr:hypothetical protein [Anaeromyxobacter sp.]MBL0276124.1 hypothetical protein [Anaeromyxobacter sp.]